MQQFESQSAALSASPSQIFLANVGALEQITLSTKVSGAALTAFEVWARGDAKADFVKLASVAADYTAPTVLSLTARGTGSSPDLTVTPAGDTAVVALDAKYWFEVMLKAAGSGASTTTTGWGK